MMMTQRDRQEIDLVRRAAAFDMQLSEVKEGEYYLIDESPDMCGIGPLDLDEVEDWLTAIEAGLCGEQAREFAEDRRWRRIHPELFEGEGEE